MAKKTLKLDIPRLQLQLRQPVPVRHPAGDAMAFVGGIVLGALMGAVAAIFLAPTDGQSLRRKLSQQLGMGDPDLVTDGVSAGPDGPLLTPRDVPAEERVAEDRLPAGVH